MKVIACGGRYYGNRLGVYSTLDYINDREGITILIEGGAKGADALARNWAHERGVPCVTVRANWNRLKLAAGPERNQRMLHMVPDLVVAFPGGKGTADMVLRARKAGVRVIDRAAVSYG